MSNIVYFSETNLDIAAGMYKGGAIVGHFDCSSECAPGNGKKVAAAVVAALVARGVAFAFQGFEGEDFKLSFIPSDAEDAYSAILWDASERLHDEAGIEIAS